MTQLPRGRVIQPKTKPKTETLLKRERRVKRTTTTLIFRPLVVELVEASETLPEHLIIKAEY